MPAYSGAELRIRDKAIEEKHRKEISALDSKFQRLRYAYDERSKEFYTCKKQGDEVASCLGFISLGEIETFMKITDEQIPYKGLAERVDALKAELAAERRDKEDLQDELIYLREERDLLKATLAENESARLSESTGQALAQELVDLQMRLYATEDKARRSDEFFKERYGKWRVFKEWMKDTEEEFKIKTKGMRTAEKTRHREVLFKTRREKLEEMGLELDDDLESPLVLPATPRPVRTTKPRSSIPPTFASSPTVIASTSTTKPRLSIPPTFASSPTVIAPTSTTRAILEVGAKLPKTPASSSTRAPLQFDSIRISRPSIVNNHNSSPIQPAPSKSDDVIDLSMTQTTATEDDSQGFDSNFPARPAPESSQENDITLVSSQAAPSKTTQKPKLPAPHPTLPPRPDFPQFGGGEKPKKQRHSDAFPATTRRDSDTTDQERPRKMRRFSSPVRAPLAAIFTGSARSSMGGASTSTSRGRENRAGPLERRVNSKAGENAPTSTPANISANKQLTDYSAFKGRGRYGKATAADTINGTYAIDPAQNGGMNFQYDAVVRGKDGRRRMAGGDCECCRDYYEAIGPLPNRLQPPLWRSPPASPEQGQGRRPCRHTDSGREEITAHKQAISRHRHDWARASTPPSYWHIGFPSTQEAEKINEKAATMHRQKQRDVEAEAEDGGRYYKTR
ncbi:hypothetical protein B0H17DRAFT_1026707 [Mycena rosella]|uniref:DNA endonuclease activator Ctp1 C-terminal domain-containing protein n=1 Tax=Mycena rosella TaxID=1033263 RepID=A0AAD7AXJ1_MYCRO|nr:hypothetical protein B0H17DRAFT_1026707 [Mycena rosella]